MTDDIRGNSGGAGNGDTPAGDMSQKAGSEYEKIVYKGVEFAHPSEEQCAKILDFYGVRWEYEPRTFPIEWDKDGTVTQSFSPDFYLPDFDLYIELTTMSQKLVTKKNRKVRMLRELHPDINIKVFYQKDFKNLLLKYGLPR